MAGRGHEGCFPFIPLTYPDEVVGAAVVQLGEDGGTTEMFQGCWDERKGITELHSDVIQCPVINTRPQAPVLFGDEKEAGSSRGRGRWMYPCWRASSMYSSMAFCSGSESG